MSLLGDSPPTAFDPLLPVSRTAIFVGSSLPANPTPRWIAPAVPVFAGKPAPTESEFRLPETVCGECLQRVVSAGYTPQSIYLPGITPESSKRE